MSIEEKGGATEEEKEKEKEKKKEKEPSSYDLPNPARVTNAQSRFVTLQTPSKQRYRPVSVNVAEGERMGKCPTGIVMLVDNDPEAPEDVVKVERVALGQEDEADPPMPFEWSEDMVEDDAPAPAPAAASTTPAAR
jgi:26S proteasome regulatory subunit RPN2 C-terminal domain